MQLLSIWIDLSLQEVLADIPHDAPAIVVYVALALCVGLLWLGGRSRPAGGSSAAGAAAAARETLPRRGVAPKRGG